MAKRTKADDLIEMLKACKPMLAAPSTSAQSCSLFPGEWHRISTEYKTDRSANASASIFRAKLGPGYRVKSIGQFVYVIFDGLPAVQGATVLENAA